MKNTASSGQRADVVKKRLDPSGKETTTSRDYVDSIVRSMADMLVVLTEEAKIEVVNQSTCGLLGYQEEELIGKDVTLLFSEEEEIVSFFRSAGLQKLIKVGSIRDREASWKTKAGEKIPVSFSGTALRDKTGKILGAVIVARDITERKRAEARTRRLATVTMDSNDAITVQDFEGKIIAWNRGAERMYGYTEAEALGMNIGDTVPEEKRAEALAFVEKLKKEEEEEEEEVPSFETQRLTKDGRILDVWLTVTALRDERNKSIGIATTERDITERKRAEKVRNKLVLQLESTNKELEGFAYAVSHDLKAPLRGIDSLAGWIAEDFQDKLDEEGKKNLGMLQTRVKKMHALIDGILEYSRIGRTREEIETIDLNKLLPGIIEFLIPPAHIQIEVQKKLPVIKAEKTRIHQVFQNLLSNAVKYANKPQGKIKLGCETEAGFWRFSVSDNGPGIEEKYHERIFGLFQTLDSTETSENTGIGLSLVKKIAELYGGRAGVKSKPGQGSTFWFTFPKTYGTQGGENQ